MSNSIFAFATIVENTMTIRHISNQYPNLKNVTAWAITFHCFDVFKCELNEKILIFVLFSPK